MRILTRYVLGELLKVFLISLTGLTTLFVVVVVIREATQQDLPLVQILRLIPYALPESLRMTVPVTLLLACTTVYSRMSGANEVVAAKALGISPMVLLWPTFGLATILSLVTVWLNDLAVSWGRNGMQQVAIESVSDIIYSVLRSQHRYSCPFFAINVKGVDGRRLLRPTVSVQARDNSPATTITAEWAEIQSDNAEGVLKISLHQGTIDVRRQVDRPISRLSAQTSFDRRHSGQQRQQSVTLLAPHAGDSWGNRQTASEDCTVRTADGGPGRLRDALRRVRPACRPRMAS